MKKLRAVEQAALKLFYLSLIMVCVTVKGLHLLCLLAAASASVCGFRLTLLVLVRSWLTGVTGSCILSLIKKCTSAVRQMTSLVHDPGRKSIQACKVGAPSLSKPSPCGTVS